MTKKLVLILTILLLALSACKPKVTPTEVAEEPAATRRRLRPLPARAAYPGRYRNNLRALGRGSSAA